MKSAITALVAFCLSLAGFAGDAHARSHAKDEKEIAALLDQLAAAVNAKDIDGIMKFYVPDVFAFDMVPPRQGSPLGKLEFLRTWSPASEQHVLLRLGSQRLLRIPQTS